MMNRNYTDEQKYIKAKKRVQEIKGFYTHLTVYIVINIFISGVIIYGLTSDSYSFTEAITHFGTYSTWLFWGIGLFFHWLGAFGFKSVFGKSWEEKKIRKIMENEEDSSKRVLRK